MTVARTETDLPRLQDAVVACRRCPRLVAHREEVAREKVRRYRAETYWGRPLAGFGDAAAKVLIVGLAPAAHGGNRTGRMFTGDRSGDFLFRALLASYHPSQRNTQTGLLTPAMFSGVFHRAKRLADRVAPQR